MTTSLFLLWMAGRHSPCGQTIALTGVGVLSDRRSALPGRPVTPRCAQAKASGEKRIYLHTQDRSTYYAKRGWVVPERFEAWEKDQWFMARDL
ncbi:hypothetical protein [Pseudomonas sp. A-B-19]|uniref:hypothetical protein n=1 Tax=Pseudomonas sp. A-B-19 TaxID=2832405 RepID=UPI00398937BB